MGFNSGFKGLMKATFRGFHDAIIQPRRWTVVRNPMQTVSLLAIWAYFTTLSIFQKTQPRIMVRLVLIMFCFSE